MSAPEFETRGWCRFAYDPSVARWVNAVQKTAQCASRDPQQVADWLRCGGTWFAGVNALDNDAQGRVGDGPSLSGEAIDFIEGLFGPLSVDRAQISIIYPDYPQPMGGESAAAFRFRRDRDAAHVDGLLPVGPQKRRHLREPHSYVLGVPLVETSQGASPMVVWEGSHLVMRDHFRAALANTSPNNWPDVDLTDVYQAARRVCFAECKRIVVHARPGEAYVIHRLALHGVAPWQHGAVAPAAGRMIAYFRPELADIFRWLA